VIPRKYRSTLDPALIAAERARRGPPEVRRDKAGREMYEPDGAKLVEFILSNNSVDIILGPPGSGKTVAMFRRVGRHMFQQAVSPRDGLRKSRWFVARNTFPELKRTTIKTWCRVFPPELYGPMKLSSPITHTLRFGDVAAEVEFLSLDDEDDIKKLRSAEYTGGCFHEVQYAELSVFREARSRTNRFPEEGDGGATWHGVIGDCNAPGEDHWLAIMTGKVDLPEGLRPGERAALEWPKGWGFFEQPPALIKIRDDKGEFVRHEVNLDAENLRFLATDYYPDALQGASHDWINNLYGNECIIVPDGSPVWPMFRRDFHVAEQPLEPVPERDVFVWLDFGRVFPAVLFAQEINSRLLVQHEMLGFNEGATIFAPKVKKFLEQNYGGCQFRCVGDPKGRDKSTVTEQSAYDIYRTHGMTVTPAPVKLNDISQRIEAVASALNDNPSGISRLLFSPRCRTLIAGMAGRYHLVREEDGELRPKKDKYSNLCDCLQYGCLDRGEGRKMAGLRPLYDLRPVRVYKGPKSLRRVSL